jgi:ribosomal protein S18 acetylase RimI-like enzyme
MAQEWTETLAGVDWNELAKLYEIAPLGIKPPEQLRTAFSNSMYACFVREEGRLIGVGRAIADGVDCAYLCDIAVHPRAQGTGLGKRIVDRLLERAQGHKKIILYAAPGKEAFYRKFGFRRMLTAMAIFRDPQQAAARGLTD